MRIVACTILALVLTACGHDDSSAPDGDPDPSAAEASVTATTSHGSTWKGGPPPFRIQYDGKELELSAYTYCYGNACVDGVIQEPIDIGSAAELRVFVPVPEFDLSVHLREASGSTADPCHGRGFAAPVEDLGGGWYLLRPFGPAGSYDVDLFASGGGDMAGILRWTTPVDGPHPTPSARLALIADHDGQPDSYGLELSIDDLESAPANATASIEVIAGNGRSLRIATKRAQDGCQPADSVRFDGPESMAKQASRLGDFPFRTTVTLILDGVVHTATAIYPDDEIAGSEPSVSLDFQPALPAWE
ncbi:hypothetical protein ASE01_05110 [Nocardioides sp. Root190]|uniref:hypothetical protein n=1 Tax=Nocardioides sp. Root190 TaxID=1736488 RepID=UPI00070181A8|nr:hypothetical protein [Nocardioides sp. Root190]KRB78631.1 hypothetical protein ASE01_05110 [Nocardioides sp. Root190]